MQGTVKWFSRLKGYGFIAPDDGGDELFAHYSFIEGDSKDLYADDRVEFDRIDRGKGPQACNIRRLPKYGT